MNFEKEICQDWLLNYWHYILTLDIELTCEINGNTFICDKRGFSLIDRDAIEYMFGEMTSSQHLILCRLLPEFNEQIKNSEVKYEI